MLFLACKERDIYERDRLGAVKPKLWQVSFPAGLQAKRAGGDACEEGGGPARLAGVGAGVTQRCQQPPELFKWPRSVPAHTGGCCSLPSLFTATNPMSSSEITLEEEEI